jgi:uncharacterized membrane protein
MAGEVVAGLAAHSLALISDAAHMLTDAASIGLVLITARLAYRLVRVNRSARRARNYPSAVCTRRHSDRIRRRQTIFAGRLGGLSGAGVADVPARRIGIYLWQTHFWRKPLINL